MMRNLLLILALLACVSTAQVYVSPSGKDTNDGFMSAAGATTPGHGPKRTIAAALATGSAKVIVLPGSYAEDVSITKAVTLVASKSATVGMVTIRANDVTVEGFSTSKGIDGSGKRITVRRCTATDTPGMGIYLGGGSWKPVTRSGNLIEGCTVARTGPNLPGIRVEGVGNTVRNCTVTDVPQNGINMVGPFNTIEGCTVIRAVQQCSDFGAIYVGGYVRAGCIIRNNVVRDTNGTTLRVGIYLDDMASGVLVEGNTVLNGGCGLHVGGGRFNVIRNNRFEAAPGGKSLRMDSRGSVWPGTYFPDMMARQLSWIDTSESAWAPWPYLKAPVAESRAVLGNVFEGNVFVGPCLVYDVPVPDGWKDASLAK